MPTNNNKTWSTDDISQLQQISHLYTLSELAQIFERSEPSVRSKLSRLGLKHRDSISTPSVEPDGFKWCPKCTELLPYAAFSKSSRGRFGLFNNCRTCEAKKKVQKQRETKSYSSISALTPEERERYIEDYKLSLINRNLFCPKCQEPKQIDDYIYTVRIRKNEYKVGKCCKVCQRRYKMRRLQERGY